METRLRAAFVLGVEKVVSLPMRDGNKVRKMWQAGAHIVVSLPMRDGNRWRRVWRREEIVLLAYL